MKRVRLFKFRSCFTVIIIIFIFIFQSCENYDLTITTDRNYPTTYRKLDDATLIQMRKDFALSNPFLSSSITDYGFCGFLSNLLPAPSTVRIPDLTKAEAINLTKSFISQNSTLLGIKSTSEVTFSRIDSFIIYDGSVKWFLSSNTQKNDGLEVSDTYLNFSLTNGKMTSCDGNWYSSIFIPPIINYDETSARKLLLNKIVYLSDIAGHPIPMTITVKSLKTAKFSKLIYPLRTTDKIELHVVWVVNIPDVYYVVYMDVMTGDIIGGYPTVLS